MFLLIDGNPVFYIGKVNGIGYTSKEERENIIKQLKEDNPDVKITDEEVEIDKEFKKKAEELGKLKLTYSKSEFMKYLKGEKTCPELEMKKLKEENKGLKLELNTSNMELLTTLQELNIQNQVTQAQLMMEVAKTIEGLKGGE